MKLRCFIVCIVAAFGVSLAATVGIAADGITDDGITVELADGTSQSGDLTRLAAARMRRRRFGFFSRLTFFADT